MLDKSLDYAWELSHSGNREKHEITIDKDKDMYVNRYTDIINDKLDLVNEIGELIDSYMADAYNIVDSINKSHNNSSAYDILAEDLKCKDTILKMINSSNVCAKQDTKNNDADNVNICDKEDTNNDKPDTNNNNDKQDTKNKDSKPGIKKKGKRDIKKKDKPILKRKINGILKRMINQTLKRRINQILLMINQILKRKIVKKKKSKPDTKKKDKQDTKKPKSDALTSKNEPQKNLQQG